jgi:hypothetical protein
MIGQTAGPNHEYNRAHLTSVVVAETTTQLLHESFLADRERSRIGRESASSDAYAAAEAKRREATSKFYGFLTRFAAARLGDDHELLERASHYNARVQQSYRALEASRPEWYLSRTASEPCCLAEASWTCVLVMGGYSRVSRRGVVHWRWRVLGSGSG